MTADLSGNERYRERKSALCLYAQLLLGMTLYARFRGAGALWLSVLLTAPFLCLIFFLIRGSRRAPSRLLSLAALMDALTAYTLLCGLCRLLLADLPPWAAAGAVTAFALLCVGAEERALDIMSRPAAWLIAIPLAACAVGCLPQGSVGRLFPLLGRGPAAVGLGGIWLTGCLTPAAAAAEGKKPGLPSLLTALLLSVATAALFSFLQPPFSPYPPASWPSWPALPARFSLPAALWTPAMSALMLLLFYAHLSGLQTAGALLARRDGKNRRFILWAAALLMFPAGALREAAFERLLFWTFPVRSAVILLSLIRMRLKKAPRPKEEQHA